MKKLILGLVVALVLMGAVAHAADNQQLTDYKYMIVNNAEGTLVTPIPTAVIDPAKHRILCFEVGFVMGSSGSTNTESVACLYDATSAGMATNKVAEGEIESNDADTVTKTYKRPLNLMNGVTMMQGSYTVVMIEWEYKY